MCVQMSVRMSISMSVRMSVVMSLRMSVVMSLQMSVGMSAQVSVGMSARMSISMSVGMCVQMSVAMYVGMSVCMSVRTSVVMSTGVCRHVCRDVCTDVCRDVCMDVCTGVCSDVCRYKQFWFWCISCSHRNVWFDAAELNKHNYIVSYEGLTMCLESKSYNSSLVFVSLNLPLLLIKRIYFDRKLLEPVRLPQFGALLYHCCALISFLMTLCYSSNDVDLITMMPGWYS